MPPNPVTHRRIERGRGRGREPIFLPIASQLLKDERILNPRGVDGFKTYTELVKEAGVAEIYCQWLEEVCYCIQRFK